jgi:hypothetical protein
MREKLRELDIRLTELADYLQISRPTLYKFIEYYENERYRPIDKGILDLFRYIDDTPGIGKKNVMGFIIQNLSNMTDSKDKALIRIVTEYLDGPDVSEDKVTFVKNVIKTNRLDDLIPYLNIYVSLSGKRSLTDEEQGQIDEFMRFKEKMITNMTASAKRSNGEEGKEDN